MPRFLYIAGIAVLLMGTACTEKKQTVSTTTTTTAVTSTTVTNLPTTSTTQRPSSTTSTTKAPVYDYVGVYPFSNAIQADAASSAWADPVFTARKFLTDYVGFTRLVMGEFHQGDSRSGEVLASDRSDGPVTTVFVRKIGTGNNWTVIGSATGNVQLTSPATRQRISSPVRIEGNSIAFEGTVLVEVRQDGQYNKDGELGFEPVQGPGTEFGPMSGEVHFGKPSTPSGAVLAYTDSAEDGHIVEVTTIKVLF